MLHQECILHHSIFQPTCDSLSTLTETDKNDLHRIAWRYSYCTETLMLLSAVPIIGYSLFTGGVKAP